MHQGYANYATWRIRLEHFSGMTASDLMGRAGAEDYEVAAAAKERVREVLLQYPEGYALGYALAFLDTVDWQEIAESLIGDEVEA